MVRASILWSIEAETQRKLLPTAQACNCMFRPEAVYQFSGETADTGLILFRKWSVVHKELIFKFTPLLLNAPLLLDFAPMENKIDTADESLLLHGAFKFARRSFYCWNCCKNHWSEAYPSMPINFGLGWTRCNLSLDYFPANIYWKAVRRRFRFSRNSSVSRT